MVLTFLTVLSRLFSVCTHLVVQVREGYHIVGFTSVLYHGNNYCCKTVLLYVQVM